MSYSHRSTRRSTDKRRLYEFIDRSSRRLIEDEDDVSRYFERFQTLSDPLIYFGFISKSECTKKGFHPNDRARLLPYLVGRRSTQQPVTQKSRSRYMHHRGIDPNTTQATHPAMAAKILRNLPTTPTNRTAAPLTKHDTNNIHWQRPQ